MFCGVEAKDHCVYDEIAILLFKFLQNTKSGNEKLQYINAKMNAIFDCSQTLVLVTCENIKGNLTPGVIRSKYKIQFGIPNLLLF